MVIGDRNYVGDPIDATMQSIRDSKYWGGETVDATDKEDPGEEMTDPVPSFVDKSDYSEHQLDRISKRVLHYESTLKDFCERFGYDYGNTSSFFKEFREKNRPQLEDAGLYERFLPPNKRGQWSSNKDDTVSTERQREIVRKYWRENPDANAEEVKSETGVNLPLNSINGIKGNLTVERQRDQTLSEVEQLRAENQRLREEMAQIRKNEPAILSELDSDALFTIVTGGTLEESDRRELFAHITNDKESRSN